MRLTGRRSVLSLLGGGSCLAALWWHNKRQKTSPVYASAAPLPDYANRPVPSRTEQFDRLGSEEFDVLVIGGGATGGGVALDAASRGLKTALVEKFDFSSGTSSRSTKLIHGGVRYLQKAVFNLDLEQYRMVKEALVERANLLEIAPHLSYPLPIMLPVYKWWLVPYFWAGIKAYDFVAGKQTLKKSYYIKKKEALELFPMLKKDALVGALVYFDGQHNDARMNISICMTAARLGAATANHAEVLSLTKGQDGVISGAVVRDKLTGKEHTVKAKCVVNATGPYTDTVRRMADPGVKQICMPSSGVHIVLPDYYSPDAMGLLDPATSDGRVIFFLPWQKHTLAGTTDNRCDLTDYPQPMEEEVEFILNEIRKYLSPDVEVRRGDVMASWSGIRPLVVDPNAKDTQSIARNHIIEVSPSHLVTVAGGKWTTYRHMAEETVNAAVKACDLNTAAGSNTLGLLLDGAHEWTPTLFIRLVQDFGLENEVSQHLANTYGDKAVKVAGYAKLSGLRWPVVGRRLHPEFPYIEAEVVYACRREYAVTALDILARRTRLAFLNVYAAEEALPRVVEIMSEQLGWSKAKQKDEFDHARLFLQREMGLDLNKGQSENVPINFTKNELNEYAKMFKTLDTDGNGFITVNDLRKYFKSSGEKVSEKQIHDLLSEVDVNKNAQVDFGEFLQMMSALRTGAVANSRLAMAVKLRGNRVDVSRSGGGV